MLYLCESSGARLLKYGVGITQVGDNHQLDLTTDEDFPAGAVGDCSFRTIDVALKASAGYAIGITPIVDGVSQTEQLFSGGNVGKVQCQAYFAARGTSVAARVRTTSRAGDLEIQELAHSSVVIRTTP